MAYTLEIERKFLLSSEAWRAEAVKSAPIQQLYVAASDGCQVRVRRYGTEGFLTIKGRREGISRVELETSVPVDFVDALIDAELYALPPIVKIRHLVPVGDFTYEIDEYQGDNAGLVVAEVELPDPETEVPRPAWLGAEVTDDLRYRNAYLASHPYTRW